MHKILATLALLSLVLFIFSCSGTDKPEEDTTPPFPPTMIPHLGDTGDPPTNYYGQQTILTDDNNGIDTVPDGNWVRISWKPFLDQDLNLVRIWRFDEFNTTPVQIDSIAPNQSYYLDSKQQLPERIWYSYFIDIVDFAGNSARSDTVSYALLAKPVLLDPPNGATISPIGARVYWNSSGFASSYRLVLFDSNHNYVWHQDLFTALEDELFIDIPVNLLMQYSGQGMYWRIDSFDWDEERQQYMGAESLERIFYVQ